MNRLNPRNAYANPVPCLRSRLVSGAGTVLTWGMVQTLLRIGLALACFTALAATSTNQEKGLTLECIFESSEFNGASYSARWMKDGSGYLTWEKSITEGEGRDLVLHDPQTGTSNMLVAASLFIPAGESGPLTVAEYTFSPDRSKLLIFTNTRRVWRANTRGDFWVLDRTSRELWKLGGDAPPATLMFAKFSPDGTRVAYVRENDIYTEHLTTRAIKRLTRKTSPEIINGTFDWVYEEEFRLRDGFRWSPDSRSIAYWQLDTSGVSAFPLVNQTDSLYPKVTWLKYPKAGEINSACRVGVVEIEKGETRWIQVPGDPRNNYIHFLEWPKNSGGVVLQQFNRLQNTNRLFVASPNTNSIKEVLLDRDEAWVEQHEKLEWLEDGRKFLWLSERDGWQRIYAGDTQSDKLRAVSPREMDVVAITQVVENEDAVYYVASPTNATQRYLYWSDLDGGKGKRITPGDQPGTHSYNISPDGKWAIHSWSTFDRPSLTELVRLPEHKTVRVFEDNKKLRETLAKLPAQKTEFFRVDLGGKLEMDAWAIFPPAFDATKKYPLLIHVYGEPAGQTVTDAWSGRRLLWHRLLAAQGCVVMSFDNRGTPGPKGRAWRKSIYRQVGILAAEDQSKVLKRVLETRSYLDAKRVGIWGWSGGGSMTLNALLQYPDLYQTGVSVAPVPNQRLYDSIYQERYMGLPQENVEGYKNGSSITFAHQLKGHLLLIHGTGDDNVHFQGSEALINELVRHKKQFTMMAYPNRSHGIGEGQNTTMHLYKLMTDYLVKHLGLEKQVIPASGIR